MEGKGVFMVLKVLSVLLLSCQVWASQGLTINDQILTDYRNAKTFKEFVEKLTKGGFPGDYQYVQQVWKAYPELLKDGALPKMNFEKGEFVLREGPSEIKVKKMKEFGVFEINGQKVTFGLYDKASQRMKKIMEATRARKTVHFALMPVVWAAETQGVPSKLQLTNMALTSVLMDQSGLPEDLLNWQMAAALEFRQKTQADFAKNVKKECLRDIETAEQSFEAEKVPFHYFQCEMGHLDVELEGTDSSGHHFALNLGPERLTVRRAKDVQFEKGLETFVFNREKDATDVTAKGYGEDEPVSATSSPFQRDMTFIPITKNKADLEIFARFEGIAADVNNRQLCRAECVSSVNAYTNLRKAYEANVMSLKEEKRKARTGNPAGPTKAVDHSK